MSLEIDDEPFSNNDLYNTYIILRDSMDELLGLLDFFSEKATSHVS